MNQKERIAIQELAKTGYISGQVAYYLLNDLKWAKED